jgi:hypothetical protein
MPPQHLTAKPAVEADDSIRGDRPPNRNRRASRADRFYRRFDEPPQSFVHRRDQDRELIWRDLIASEIPTDNPGGE